MHRTSGSVRTGAALERIVWCALVVGAAVSAAGAAEKPTLESIRGRIREQWEQVYSLHIRLRQETTLSVEPEVLAAWRSKPTLPRFSGTEDVLFAFDGEKRYLRVLGLECQLVGRSDSLSSKDGRNFSAHDDARVWDGTRLRQRNKDGHGHFQYRIVAPEEASGSFAPPQYLANAGFAVPDPTAGSEAASQLRSGWHLPTLLQSPSYAVADAIEQVEGSRCLVVQKGSAIVADSAPATAAERDYDKLWLDVDHGLALRKRELRIDDQLVRVINGDFVEAVPGLWLPSRSRTEYFAPQDAAEKYRDRPILIHNMSLAGHVVNQVPADFFDVVLIQQRSPPSSMLEVVKAYHVLQTRFSPDSVEEVWVADGLGRRMEVRKGPEVELLRIDTPAWTLVWRPKVNRATLLPSRLRALLLNDASIIGRREDTLRMSEELTAFFRIEKGRLGDRNADKLTAYYPVDPVEAGNWPIHEFDPQLQAKISGTDHRTRETWFDPENGLGVCRRCGCRNAKWEATIDFPDPASVGKNRFTFQLPPEALLESTDDGLRGLFNASADNEER